MLNPPHLEELEQLRQKVKTLSAQVVTLSGRIKELESRLSMNSQNSSKPPSSDGLRKPNPKSSRRKSDKSSGGQEGHRGHTLNQVEVPDEVKMYETTEHCSGCQASLEGVKATLEIRQEFEIPVMKVRVIEHQVHVKKCGTCGQVNKGRAPITNPTQYGKSVEALAVYLGQYQLLPFARTAQLFQDLFSLAISQGTLANIYKRCHGQLAGFEEKVKTELITSSLVHFDESGLSIGKILNWLHVASNEKYTCYSVDPKRGCDAMDRMGILPAFKGRAVHDHWKSYFKYSCLHSLCNAHHFRELRYQAEEYEQNWCVKMTELLIEMKQAVKREIALNNSALPEAESAFLLKRYDGILEEALGEFPPAPEPAGKRGRKKKHPAVNLWIRLLEHKDNVVAFMKDFTIPFTNNQGERDIRMIKIKQKISGCFRSKEGAQHFCRIRGFISTARKQGLGILEALFQAFHGNPFLSNTT